jgi:hypothetical protein
MWLLICTVSKTFYLALTEDIVSIIYATYETLSELCFIYFIK